MTIAGELSTLLTTKGDIMDELERAGVFMPPLSFAEYHSAINSIVRILKPTETIVPYSKSGHILFPGGARTITKVSGLATNVGVAVTGSNGGQFIIAADGAWTFDPSGDFSALTGTDTADTSVTYHASDGTSEAMSTLTITVNAAQLWTPSEIATALWLKEFGTEASWTDQSGNARHAVQETASARPQTSALNGLQIFNFDGGDWMLTPNIFTSASDASIFVVKKATSSNTTGRGVFALSNGLNSLNGFFHAVCRTDLTNGFRSLFTIDGYTNGMTIKYPPVAFATGSWVISGHGRSTENQFLSWNGTHSEVAVSGRCNFANAKGVVGGYYDETFLWSGQIAEIIVCPAYVDSTTRQKIEGYLAHKWGLTANLPSDHPYKNAAPKL